MEQDVTPRTIATIAHGLFALAATGITFVYLGLPLPLVEAIGAAFAIGVILVGTSVFAQTRGLFARMLHLMPGLKLRFASWQEGARDLGRRLARYYRQHRGRMGLSCGTLSRGNVVQQVQLTVTPITEGGPTDVSELDVVLRRVFSHRIRPSEIGIEALRQWASALDGAMQVRDRTDGAPGRFLDVYYSDLVRDPIAAVQRIYAHYDLRFTNALETRMRRFLTQNPKDKHGVHHYSLAQFGLSPDEVATYFQAYVARFKPEPEVA